MTWHELFTALERADPASEVVVVLYRLRGAPEVFALEEAQDTGEYVRLAIYEDEPVAEGCGHDPEGWHLWPRSNLPSRLKTSP